MKRIAVITGASSGIGKTFAETIRSGGRFDEVWVIARNADRLEALRTSIPFPLRPLALDLADSASLEAFAKLLANDRPEIALLINSAGFGKFAAAADTSLADSLGMIDLNCKALTAMCLLSIPYMTNGARIINVASVAAFQPIPYINVYAASKAYVLSFSRALNRELRPRGITVTAVCPFWTKTAFFDRALTPDQVVKKYVAMYTPEQIVTRAWRDAMRRRDVSQYGFVARTQALLAKLLPHSFVMSYWQNQQKLP